MFNQYLTSDNHINHSGNLMQLSGVDVNIPYHTTFSLNRIMCLKSYLNPTPVEWKILTGMGIIHNRHNKKMPFPVET